MKYTLPVLALLGYVSASTIHSHQSLDLAQMTQVDAMTEANRYYGADGNPIILSETSGHARLELTKVKKHTQEHRQMLMQLEKNPAKKCTKEQLESTVNHCPVNGDGPSEVHLQQDNLEDNAYISDIYIGNPPQKLRALFDTGSTNTWVLNDKVVLPGGAMKEYSYKDQDSCSSNKLPQRAMIQFGSGALAGHFMTDDMRVGTCDGKSSGQVHIKD